MMAGSRRGRRRDERGAALILVLVFITALSLVIGALLFGSSTAQKSTVVTATLTDAYYAADAGVEYGVSLLRQRNGLCWPGASEELPDDLANGPKPTVTCGGADSDEAGQGASSYAVVTFNPGPGSLTSQSGNVSATGDKIEKQVSGRTFVNGEIDLKSKLRSNSSPPDPASPTYPRGDGVGFVYQRNGACTAQPAGGVNLLITPNYKCTPLTAQQIDPKPPLPPMPSETRPRGPAVPPADFGEGTCGIFLPGIYDDDTPFGPPSKPNPLGLLDDTKANYLASGVYYFKDIGEVSLNNYRVFAGEDADEPKTLTDPPCASDTNAIDEATAAGIQTGMNPGDRGVQIILGGNSWLNIDNADAEFLAYRPVASGAGRGVSIRTVRDANPQGYQISTPGGIANGLGLTIASGNNPHFSVHGMVYAPNAKVVINDTNTSAAQILGGVMAWDLAINASASAAALVIQVTGERPRSRSKIVIESTVPVSGTKSIKGRAVVDVFVEPPSRTVTDGVTNGTTTVTSATANFMPTDVGSSIFGPPIEPRTFIKERVDSTTIRISQAAPAQGVVEMTIDPSSRTATDATITDGNIRVTSSAIGFTADDVGASIVSAATLDGKLDERIPFGTSIVSVNSPDAFLSQPPDFPGPSTQSNVRISVTKRRVTVNVISWRVDNP